jgi:hypothetical protein
MLARMTSVWGCGRQAQAPLVQRVFGGELASHVACQGCDHEAATAEPFLDISVSIPQAAAPAADRRARTGLQHAAWGGCWVCASRCCEDRACLHSSPMQASSLAPLRASAVL